MFSELLLPCAALITFAGLLAIKHGIGLAQGKRQLEIARRGAPGHGRVVAIQRPFLLDACTRFYIDYVPEGGVHPVRACHIERRPFQELRPSLPAAGSIVSVRYLPERPTQAAIARLIAS